MILFCVEGLSRQGQRSEWEKSNNHRNQAGKRCPLSGRTDFCFFLFFYLSLLSGDGDFEIIGYPFLLLQDLII